jgi:hypothetical protein
MKTPTEISNGIVLPLGTAAVDPATDLSAEKSRAAGILETAICLKSHGASVVSISAAFSDRHLEAGSGRRPKLNEGRTESAVEGDAQ